MNSPTLDHNGKMLSYDGQKVFTANSRGRGSRGRGNQNNNRNDRNDRKRGNDNNPSSSGGGRGGKSKKPVIYTLSFRKDFTLFFQNNSGQSDNKQWCRFHQSRSSHGPEDCFLNRESKSFKGEEFLQKFEQKHKRKLY